MMDRKEAADLLDNLIGMVEDNHGEDYDTALKMGIGALTADGDTIYRQAALELVRDVCDAIMSCCESHYDEETGYEVYDDVREISAILKCNKEIKIALKNMPSALPLLNQATISEDRCGECDAWNKYKNYPSAQPEIIRCKDCKHQVKEWRDDKRLKDKSYWVYGCKLISDVCGYWAGFGQDDGFCSEAERRTDDER